LLRSPGRSRGATRAASTGRVAGWALAGALAGLPLLAAGLPLAPARWVSDRAGVLSPAAAERIDRKLEAFEREQGSQVLVAIFRALPADESLEDWTQRVAESWRVGRARQDDGAVLFAFVDDRKLRLEVGYGLEGALTDLESKRILDGVLVPRLRAGDWDGGFDAATDAILTAIRGEFGPDAVPPAPGGQGAGQGGFVVFLLFLVILFLVISARRAHRQGGFRGGGPWGSSGGGWGGGGLGGGFGGGGFGGFSGGGGSFGGGGASGRW
jgi:uncharacterized protein